MARGTRMNAAAAASGFLVLYPEQTVAAQLLKCWNWYTAAQYARDSGEAALLAGLVDSVARAEGVAAARVALVGMSAGAAMAANLVAAYPERYSALAMHSGLPALSAIDAAGAMSAMKNGAVGGDSLGARVIAAMGVRVRAIPVIVLHGGADKVVAPANLDAVRRQWSRSESPRFWRNVVSRPTFPSHDPSTYKSDPPARVRPLRRVCAAGRSPERLDRLH